VANIAQDALEMGFGGWMIEGYWRPEAAWSDAKQQLTPEECGKLIQELAYRCGNAAEKKDRTHRTFEKKIEEFDEDLNILFAKRLALLWEMKGYHQEQKALMVVLGDLPFNWICRPPNFTCN
jgi:chorismate mutase